MNGAQFHRDTQTFSEKNTYEKIRRLYDFKRGTKLRILDVGCGNGGLDELLTGLGHDVTGMDVQSASLRTDTFGYIEQDVAADWQVPHDRFDMVICTDVAEHLYDPTHILRQSEMVLKKSGALIFGVPNHFDLRQRIRMLFGKGIVHWDNVRHRQESWNYSHIRFFTLSELLLMLRKAGWHIERLQLNFMGGGLIPTRFTPTFLRSLLLRLWPNVFSGKFVVCVRKMNGESEWDSTKMIYIPFTPKDF